MASSSHNVELEAAKFLHKLIQDSKDEPAKLATKLYVILQHMKSSGKEHSMPFQVISRAMETVINRHGLDLEALKASRLPLTGGSETVDSTSVQYSGSSQAVAVPKDSKAGLAQNEMSKFDPFSSSRPPVGPSIAGHEYYQGAGTHRSSQSFDHESPSSLDTRSANSQSQDKQMNQSDSKKAPTKRKRGDSSSPLEPNFDNFQQLDSRNAVIDPRKGKMNKVEPSGPANYNMVPSSGQMEHFPSLPGNMRSMLKGRQDGQNVTENLVDSTNISSFMSRAPSSKYPEELEVSSTQNAPGQQQGGAPGAHEVFSSRGVWTQNKAGLPFDRSQLHRFSSNVVSGNMTGEIASQQSMHASLVSGAFGKVQGGLPATSNSYPVGELAFSGLGQFSGSESQKHGLSKGAVTSPDGLSTTLSAGKVLEHDVGSSNTLADANKTAQVGRQNSASEMTMLRAMAPRDTGKFPVSQSTTSSGMPFKEQQLKQLRAQCLVFLAFRNGLMPKKLHLEIALGNIVPKEDGPRKELNDNRGKAQTSIEPSSISEVAMPFGRMNNAPPGFTSTGRFPEADSLSKEAEKSKMEESNGPTSDLSAIVDERKYILATRKAEAEIQSQDTVDPQAYLTMPRQPDFANTKGGFTVFNSVDGVENGHLQVGKGDLTSSVMGANRQVNLEMMGWSGIGHHNEISKACLPATAVHHDLVIERKDTAPSQFQSSEQDEEDKSVSSLPSPKHTMSEKWIMDQQKRKHLAEQNWVIKQQKTRQRIVTCFTKLKENVSSSEDIYSKTKSVIELKKLQLLELQRRLRSDFLNDFFKPITNDMERLKSYKKHRHGRRIKQLERYEVKMKDERQKRIRERQKEFFSEIEVHKERLDDVFKIRRERWKGFNKYVKEFHKRKERIHREKIDRIQREKINLLKINDVEGYLRMVQDAKSDRVKQLLKETEKYLQKLGSKLKDAKVMTNRFENDMDEVRTAIVDENDTSIENEDEAKHYMESNEKYYLMAHSIKETISEQPSFLKGGKLREYQMNGLRWLVSLYNNHLNGILADEMGLGKTVQVISLICYLMENKNDRGPFLVVVPSSVLPGWDSEISFWAPEIHKIVYAGPPEERRRLFKERIVHQKFNVLLTTYEYLMNKHDRPKLSKVHWHYIIIDEGHRIKNASCKLNSELKHYQSAHRLLLTGTPLQNNLEELWALLNFLLPNIFNSSDDFSQWFNKPFEGNGDNSADEALLSEEENLLIINRLHQVLRPFVLRRLKHKVENELPEKIERLVRCEASAYQKLLMKRVEENLGAIGNSKARSVHNSVMELRNICNHPYLSQLHVEEVDSLIPQHYLPTVIRLCGKLEMLDRLLPKLKATDHRVLFFSTMTRLLDVMEDYLVYKQYRYLRLDGHTSGNDRGALIDKFNQQGSPYFIFLLSIRAGGVGVNLQAADTVIIFDTDWNPQVDLQAQARAHRIGQKKDVLVLRFETVQTVEEQVRAAAEHKLGVANQSITAGFFDNNTSAEDRREYLESLLRECKKEEAAPVLDDDALNDLLARSESEIDVFESVDNQRREEEVAKWKRLMYESGMDESKPIPPFPSRLVTDDDLKEFYEAMKLYDVPKTGVQPNVGVKRKGESLGGLDTLHYGRGKRAREVRSYEEQWTEEEFEKMCQVDSPESPKVKEEAAERNLPKDASMGTVSSTESLAPHPHPHPPPLPPPPPPPTLPQPQPQPQPLPVEPAHQPQQLSKDATPPSKRGRGRPRRATAEKSPTTPVVPAPTGISKVDAGLQKGADSISSPSLAPDPRNNTGVSPNVQPSTPSVSSSPCQTHPPGFSPPAQSKGQGQKAQTGGPPRRRGKKQEPTFSPAVDGLAGPAPEPNDQSQTKLVNPPDSQLIAIKETVPGISSIPIAECINPIPISTGVACSSGTNYPTDAEVDLNSQLMPTLSSAPVAQSIPPSQKIPIQVKGRGRKAQSGVGTPRRRGKKQAQISTVSLDVSAGLSSKLNPEAHDKSADASPNKVISMRVNQDNDASDPTKVIQEAAQGTNAPVVATGQDQHSTMGDNLSESKQPENSIEVHNSTAITLGPVVGQIQNANLHENASVITGVSPECSSLKAKSGDVCGNQGGAVPVLPVLSQTSAEVVKSQISEETVRATISTTKTASSVASATIDLLPTSNPLEGADKTIPSPGAKISPSSLSFPTHSPVASASQSAPSCPPESVQSKRPGRKTTNRNSAEAPRRRGRKPAIPDSSSGQDLKVNSLPQNKSRDLLVNKATAVKSNQDSGPHELEVHASQVYSPGASVGHDSKGKVTAAIPAFSRIQTADITDVARVMKEIFSETSSSKNKVGEPSGSEGRNTPTAPLSNKTLDEVVKNQSSDGKSVVSMPALEKSAPACDVPAEKIKKPADTEVDAKEQEDNASLQVKAPIRRADSLEPECKIHTASENLASSRQILSENSITENNMEVDGARPLNGGDMKDVSQGTPTPGGDQTASRVQHDSPCPMELSQSDNTNTEAAIKESPKADNTVDNSRVVLSDSGVVEPSIHDCETKKDNPALTDIYSGHEVEPSFKEPPRVSDGNSRSSVLNDIPAETSAVSLSGESFDKSDMPSLVTRCSDEAIVAEHSDGPENSNNLGTSFVVEDTAQCGETATLDDAPIYTCDVSGQSGGNEAGDPTGSRVQHDTPCPMELPQTESDNTNIEAAIKESPKADNSLDNSRVVLSVAGVVEPSINDSETEKDNPAATEIYSGHEVESSLKETPSASDGNSRSVGLNDIPAETLVSGQSAASLSGESFDKSDVPSLVTRCSDEAFVAERSDDPDNSNNLVTSSVVEDTAPSGETATLDEAPIYTCDVDGQSGGNEAGDPTGSRVQHDSPCRMEVLQTESDNTNVEAAIKELPKADNAVDNSREVLSVAGVVGPSINDSETKKDNPAATEIYSGHEVEPSSEEIPRASDGNSRSVGRDDIPAETLVSDQSAASLSGESFDKSDAPSLVTRCSDEAFVAERSDDPDNSNNPGTSSVVEDTAPGGETATLDEALIYTRDVDDQSGGNEAGDQMGSRVQHDSPCPMEVLQTECDNTNIEAAIKELPKADNTFDNSREVLSVAGVVGPSINDSETNKDNPAVTEIYSEHEVEPSSEEIPRAPDGNSRSVGLDDIPAETLISDQSAASLSGESFDKSDLPSIVTRSDEAIVAERSDAPENLNNVGTSSVFEDTASGGETATLDVAPIYTCDLDGQSSGNKAKGNPVTDPVLSIATESTDIDRVPREGVTLPQPLTVKDKEGSGVEIHNMEVDASETEVPSPKDFTAVSTSRDSPPEVNVDKQSSAGVESMSDGMQVFDTEGKPSETQSSEPDMLPLETVVPIYDILQDKNIEESWTDADGMEVDCKVVTASEKEDLISQRSECRNRDNTDLDVESSSGGCSKMHLQVGDGDIIQVGNTKVDSEASEVTTKESPKGVDETNA